MRRREFIVIFAAAVASRPVIAFAQVSTKRPLIAVLIGASQAASQHWRNGLPQGLQELGYVEGRDYDIEYRYADGDLTRQPVLVDELIRHKPNVIVVGNGLAAQRAGSLLVQQEVIAPDQLVFESVIVADIEEAIGQDALRCVSGGSSGFRPTRSPTGANGSRASLCGPVRSSTAHNALRARGRGLFQVPAP